MKLRILISLFLTLTVRAYAQQRRTMVVDDLFNIETLTDVRLSPDGSTVAVVIQRAWSTPETYRPYSMFGNDQADIWLVQTTGGTPRNITHGARDGSGYWNPVWSPDGGRLALLSTAGGDNVRAYTWEKRSGRLLRVDERGVDMRVRTNVTGDANPLRWLDANRLLVTVLPAGEQPFSFRVRRQTARIASAAWQKLVQGREPTASVLDGGVAATPTRDQYQLLQVDVTTLHKDVLVEGPVKYVLVSPDGKQAAVITQERRLPPRPGTLLGSIAAPSRLGVVSLRGTSGVRWIDGAFNPAVEFGTFRHRWSPQGSSLAILGTADPASDSPRAVFLVTASDGSVRRVADALDVSAIAWSNGEQLVVRGTSASQSRSDWWRVSAQGELRNLTTGLAAVPAALMRTDMANELLGFVDGAVQRFDAATGDHRALDVQGHRLMSVLWPSAEERATGAVTSLIARTEEADHVVRLDVSGPVVIGSFSLPSRATTIAAYDRNRNIVVVTAPNDPDGTFLWTGSGVTTTFVQRLALNEQLAGIAAGDTRLIEYRSNAGQELKAILILPPGYEKGIRYPLVTWVYPDTMIRDVASEINWTPKNHAHMDNLHILAGHGYAVLIPSMPPSETGGLAELSTGVMPAIDRAVELGIADPERVGLMGQSGGGFVTYGLITQTKRFKAAIAMNGFADLVSAYGTFSGESRYTDDFDDKFAPWGDRPWVEPERTLKNSPITVIDRVETPLLILHGDIDYIPIQQAEEVFTSLSRLGKRVRFVRYWGESHGVGDSPANIRDRWKQVFLWLDTYLRDR
jgi:dipeptidyl aminopeptidase/acylaminoacyl peptidase